MLVLDANILIRAVLGSRVLLLLREYSGQVAFFAPEAAFEEAREHLPGILERRQIDAGPALETLGLLSSLVQIVEVETYARFEALARERLGRRDEDDWPVLATALVWMWRGDLDNGSRGVVFGAGRRGIRPDWRGHVAWKGR
jgi:predicted nucleic acid-binding protein